jgi:uncharacterized glyoxalase superfamily protein PhnB
MTGVILVVANIPNAEQFYRSVFGWSTVTPADAEAQPDSITLVGDDCRLVLTAEDKRHNTQSPVRTGSNSATPILQVRELDQIIERLLSAGGKLHSGPKVRPWGTRAALVSDVDGHRWMLEEETS